MNMAISSLHSDQPQSNQPWYASPVSSRTAPRALEINLSQIIFPHIPDSPPRSSPETCMQSDANPSAVFEFLAPSPVQHPQLTHNLLYIPDSPIEPITSRRDLDVLDIPEPGAPSSIQIDGPPAPSCPDSKQLSPIAIDLSLLDIPPSPPTDMQIDSTDIQDPPPRLAEIIDLTSTSDSSSCTPGPIPPTYDMSPALPILVSEAAMYRTALADKMMQRAHIHKWLDMARMQLAECDRQILMLEGVQLMEHEAERIAKDKQ